MRRHTTIRERIPIEPNNRRETDTTRSAALVALAGHPSTGHVVGNVYTGHGLSQVGRHLGEHLSEVNVSEFGRLDRPRSKFEAYLGIVVVSGGLYDGLGSLSGVTRGELTGTSGSVWVAEIPNDGC